MNRLKVLYEDNHIIVVIKPANIPVQADNSKDLDMITIIKAYLKEKYNKPGNVYLGLVHRLDRPVSGIMVFAKTSKAASRLCEQIRTRSFKKGYLAIVHGTFDNSSGKLENYIVKQNDNTSKVSVNGDGKVAKLKYDVLMQNKEKKLSLVAVDLETGRHHQIRVQFAYIKHPLYGDQRYGFQDKKQIALFEYKLEFVHPVKKELMKFDIKPSSEGVWTIFNSVK